MKSKLISIDKIEDLDISQITNLYSNYINKSKTDLLKSFSFGNEEIIKSEGIHLINKKGEIFYDFTGGVGVLSHGHNHPRILKVRENFSKKKKMEVYKSFLSPYLATLSHNIAQLLPEDLNYSFFPNSGSETLDNAIRTIFLYHNNKRHLLMHSDISFHGKNLNSANITESPELNYKYPINKNTIEYKFNDIDSVKKIINSNKNKIAGIFVEPFSCSTLKECSNEFLISLREICTENNIILVFDEIYSGWCKTGPLFNFMKVKNLVPDILCMAKSFGGGKASIAGIVTRSSIHKKCYENSKYTNLQSSTYYGFGEECITAIEAINILIDENFENQSYENAVILEKIYKNLKTKFPKQILGYTVKGSISGLYLNSGPELFMKILKLLPIELTNDDRFLKKLVCAAIVDRLFQKHKILTLISFATNTHLIIAPSINIEKKYFDNLQKALDECFQHGLINCIKDFVLKKIRIK